MVKIAALFCASFNLFAIVCLKRDIGTSFRSSALLKSALLKIDSLFSVCVSEVLTLLIRSPFVILPSLLFGSIFERSIFCSSTIFLTAGESFSILVTTFLLSTSTLLVSELLSCVSGCCISCGLFTGILFSLSIAFSLTLLSSSPSVI